MMFPLRVRSIITAAPTPAALLLDITATALAPLLLLLLLLLPTLLTPSRGTGPRQLVKQSDDSGGQGVDLTDSR